MIDKELDSGVLTLRMAHGKASVLDLEFVQALNAAFEEAEKDADVQAVVLTGSGGIFCAGVDLKRILEGGEFYASQFLPSLDQMFETLFALGKPVVAAVNGHAIAGGCILVLGCDIRLMTNGGGRIGIPELKVGVPFPASAFEMLRFCVPKAVLQSLMYQAETFPPESGLQLGLVDELLVPDELMSKAHAIASELAAIPAESFRISKQMMRSEALAAMRQARAEFGAQILGRWSQDATYAHIRGYLESTLKK